MASMVFGRTWYWFAKTRDGRGKGPSYWLVSDVIAFHEDTIRLDGTPAVARRYGRVIDSIRETAKVSMDAIKDDPQRNSPGVIFRIGGEVTEEKA